MWLSSEPGSFLHASRANASSTVRKLIVLTVALNAAYLLSLVLVARGEAGYDTLWDGWIFHIATTLPALLAGFRAVTDRRLGGAWMVVAVGILLNTVANLIFTYHDSNLDPVPFPAWSDAAFIGSYLAFAVALAWVMWKDATDRSKGARLDGLVIGLTVAAVAVALWFTAVLEQTGSTAAVLVGLAYPLFDVLFIVVVVGGLAPARFRPTWSAGAFMVGALVFAVGDVVFLNQVAAETYVPGTWLEGTWVVGMLLFGLAPWAPERSRDEVGRSRPEALAIPAIAALLSLLVLAAGLAGYVTMLASWLAVCAIAAVLARVGLTVLELKEANLAFGQARTDELTRLTNRRGFGEEVDRRLEDPEADLAVMVLDLDGFKEVNDSLGHHAGDQLLAVLAERFSRAVPPGTMVARLGGDEFGLVLPADLSIIEAVGQDIQKTMTNPMVIDGISIRVGASIGVAMAPDHGTTQVELLRAADVAMYDAKTEQLGMAWYSETPTPTRETAWRSSRTSAKPSTTARSPCTTNPRSTWPRAGSSAWKRSSVGTIRCAVPCLPTSSSPSPSGSG